MILGHNMYWVLGVVIITGIIQYYLARQRWQYGLIMPILAVVVMFHDVAYLWLALVLLLVLGCTALMSARHQEGHA